MVDAVWRRKSLCLKQHFPCAWLLWSSPCGLCPWCIQRNPRIWALHTAFPETDPEPEGWNNGSKAACPCHWLRIWFEQTIFFYVRLGSGILVKMWGKKTQTFSRILENSARGAPVLQFYGYWLFNHCFGVPNGHSDWQISRHQRSSEKQFM